MRGCLLEPVPAIFEAARLLRLAADAHAQGDSETAGNLFEKANLPSVRDWTESIWGKHRPDVLRYRKVPNAPPLIPSEARIRCRMPTRAEQEHLIAHYGYRCAFCGIPLIHKRVRARAAKAYPSAVTWGRTNITQHAAFQAMWLQFDHVLPHARGGDNSFGNLVVTCAPCNFGRMNYTLEELDLADPRKRPVQAIDWDGLEGFR